MTGGSRKSSKHATFPFSDTAYWKEVTESIQSVTAWSPLILAQELHHVKQLQRDTPLKSTPESRCKRLLELFEETEEFEGDEGLPWGGTLFRGRDEEFPKIVFWFMKNTLPHIVKLLVELPVLFAEVIPLVDGVSASYLSLTKHQCASLLAAAFFCVNTADCQPLPADDYQTLVNFDSWIQSPTYSSKAKLFMLMNYFERSRIEIKDDKFEIHRMKLTKRPSLASWVKNSSPLTKFTVCDEGGITESSGSGVLHVDFANEYVGGGVLHMGAVQEEIMFSACPELLVSLMFCSVMAPDEALVLVNAERVAEYSGYNTGLQFAGDYVETDSGVCRVAIDASCYGWGKASDQQYSHKMLLRELNKALVGFDHEFPAKVSDVATGNWGCGAFGGNIQLKSLLQWCAASATGRGVRYYTFNDRNCQGLESVVRYLSEKSLTVGLVVQAILDYCEIRSSGKGGELFDFISKVL